MAACPLVMINAAPASESSMPMIWLRWMASWPDTKENSSTTSGDERHDQRQVDRRGRDARDIDRAAADEHAEEAGRDDAERLPAQQRRAFRAAPSRQPAAGRAPRCSSERTRSRTAERCRQRRAPESCWRPGRWRPAESRAGPALRVPCWAGFRLWRSTSLRVQLRDCLMRPCATARRHPIPPGIYRQL